MVAKVENHQKQNNLLFGGAAVILLMLAIGGNYYLAAQSILLRVVIFLAATIMALFLFYKTTIGQQAWQYWQEAMIEVRKVVWPTKKETIQSTVGVLAMVVIMGIFLWTVDAILVRVVAWLLHLGGA